jgi:hypothetical protein
MMSFQSITNEHIEAANKILRHFESERWCILLAQMQSGKTFTFLLVCCEMIRLHLVENVVIFSGNSDTDLRDQLEHKIDGTDDEFYEAYTDYLEDYYNLDRNARKTVKKVCKEKISIIWGICLKKYSGSTQNTLFIWEEAHHAQSIGQCPDKFLRQIGISADGNSSPLKSKNNYVLSVSATPFSELSDNSHEKQHKMVVYLKPGNRYTSVKLIRDSGRLKSFSSFQEGLCRGLRTPHSRPKYAIVRMTKKNEEAIKEIISLNDWSFIIYDSIGDREEKDKAKVKELIKKGEEAWKNMENAPEKDTVILIRGKCRMGKNLCKQHILFVMETAKNSRTDTVLQSLLGRVCGYSVGSNQIDIYLHQKIVNSGEIDRYVELIEIIDETEEVYVIPKKANNLTIKKVSITDPIIPIVIKRDRNQFPSNDHRTDIINDVYDAFLNHPERILNKNRNIIFEEIRAKYLSAWNENKSKLSANYLAKGKKTRGKDKALLIKNAFEKNEAKYFGSGGGIDSEGTEIKIWVNKDIDELDTELFYISAATKHIDNTLDERIPKTTKREVFAHRLEDGSEIDCNGGMPKLLSPSTATDWTAMCDELSDFVEVSRNKAYFSGVISLGTNEDGQPNGIIVSDKVLKELIEGGRIFKTIKNMGATLKVTKSRGPIPKSLKDKNLIKLASITWI